MTRILGIDPGLAHTGYGVIEGSRSGFVHIAHGSIGTSSDSSTGKRLKEIHDAVRNLIAEYAPSAAGVESLFFAKNITSAIPVAQARGVVLYTLEEAGVPARAYPPQEIKRSISGNGRADKFQIQDLVRIFLGLAEIPTPDHAADALAAAICCYQTMQLPEALRKP